MSWLFLVRQENLIYCKKHMYHKELKCKDMWLSLSIILCQRSPRVLHTDNAFAERHCLRGVITPGYLQKPPIPQGFIQNQWGVCEIFLPAWDRLLWSGVNQQDPGANDLIKPICGMLCFDPVCSCWLYLGD